MTMRNALLVSAFLLLIVGCTSRYRMDFFVTEDGERNKVKILQREFIIGSQLNDPLADEKVVAGSGNTVVVTMNLRGDRKAAEYGAVLGYDENLRYRLYIHMTEKPGAQTVSLPGNSFIFMVGRFDLPVESKIYLPTNGQMVVDSVRDEHMFATMNGQFATKAGDSLAVDGRIKVKISQ